MKSENESRLAFALTPTLSRRERGQEGARQTAQQNLDEPDLEKGRVFHQPSLGLRPI